MRTAARNIAIRLAQQPHADQAPDQAGHRSQGSGARPDQDQPVRHMW